MAAKRRKKHKNKISGLVISMCYNVKKSTKIGILTFYESIKFRLRFIRIKNYPRDKRWFLRLVLVLAIPIFFRMFIL